jgi:hypothetical protein
MSVGTAIRRLTLVLFLLICPKAVAEPIGPFVFRVCFTNVKNKFTVVSMPVVTRDLSSMCVTVVPCESADFDILEVPSGSKMTHYVSKNTETCR